MSYKPGAIRQFAELQVALVAGAIAGVAYCNAKYNIARDVRILLHLGSVEKQTMAAGVPIHGFLNG